MGYREMMRTLKGRTAALLLAGALACSGCGSLPEEPGTDGLPGTNELEGEAGVSNGQREGEAGSAAANDDKGGVQTGAQAGQQTGSGNAAGKDGSDEAQTGAQAGQQTGSGNAAGKNSPDEAQTGAQTGQQTGSGNAAGKDGSSEAQTGQQTESGNAAGKDGSDEAQTGAQSGPGTGSVGEKNEQSKVQDGAEPGNAAGKDVPGSTQENVTEPKDTTSGDSGEIEGLWGLDNLEKYVKYEEMGEYALSCLRWMAMFYSFEPEGSFILDGFDAKAKAVAEQIHRATGRTACWIVQQDFDGDGREEAFAYVCGLDSDGGIEVWFAAADGSVQQLMEDNTYSSQGYIKLPGNTFYVCSIAGASMSTCFLYEVDGNTARPAALGAQEYLELLENGRICVDAHSNDMFSLAGDYDKLVPEWYTTIKYYYYYYDENGFHEYSGVPVTEEEFCQYENGLEILNAIRKSGGIVKDIYYFGDGRMVVNYVESDVILEEALYEKYGDLLRRNHYLQVPVLSEGEKGFVLGWDPSLDIRAMQQEAASHGEYDIFVRDGVYEPVWREDLAEFPDYQPPFEYYKEKFAGMKKEELEIYRIRGIAEETPEKIELLATGADLSDISCRNLLFRFTDEFRDRVRERNEALGENAADGAGALLGLAASEKMIGIWIGEECILKGSLQKYISGSTAGFATEQMERGGDSSVYADCLVFVDSEKARSTGVFTAKAAVKLHAFAEAAGLAQKEEVIRIEKPGTYRTEQEYLVDLNGDGTEESLFFGQNMLLVDGKNYSAFLSGLEGVDNDSFFVWDMDTSDGIMEIGLWDHGASSSEFTWLFWYDGESLRSMGCVEGPWDKAYTGIGFDGTGTIWMNCRLSILQNWAAKKSFRLNEKHELAQVKQELYYTAVDQVEEYPYTLLMPVRLYEAMNISSESMVVQAGEKLRFLATDDKNFVLAETRDGVQGYLYLENEIYIEKPEGGFYERSQDVIEGLNFAG